MSFVIVPLEVTKGKFRGNAILPSCCVQPCSRHEGEASALEPEICVEHLLKYGLQINGVAHERMCPVTLPYT